MNDPTVPAVSLRQLQYIVAVADLGGFRRAADVCHVAQPSLSAQIALAERQLDVQIFERDRRRVRVSTAGAAIVEHARRVLLAAQDLAEIARRHSNPFHGTLRIGLIPTVSPYLLPDAAPSLGRAFPKLTIIWSEERTGTLVKQIKEGALDGAILALEAGLGDLEHTLLLRDPFVLAAAPGNPVVKTKAPATPRVLDGTTVLLLDDGHCFRDQALRICARAGAGEAGFRATSLSTLVQMVSAGDSVTLLPSLALPIENRRGQLRIRAFAPPGPSRTLVLAWRRGSALAPALERLGTSLRATLNVRNRDTSA
jgi:LysR family hydrogen peroxide-inducible transcriptional activator